VVHAVVAGALVQGGQVLLGHRTSSRRWYPDVWDLPGGHVEQGESEPQALIRELREELGVQVLGRDCEAVTTLHLTAGDGVEELRLAIWRVRKWRRAPVNRCPEEHDHLGWFSADELEELTLAHGRYQEVLGAPIRQTLPSA